MRIPVKYTLCCFLFLVSCFCFSQNRKTDSLLLLLKNDKEDTIKAIHLNELGWELQNKNTDTSIILSSQSLSLAEKIDWKKGIINALESLGAHYRVKDNFPKMLETFFKAIQVDEKMNNKLAIAGNNVRIGITYSYQGNYAKALTYYLKGLKIYEQLNNKNGVELTLGNIGIVYKDQCDYSKALEYYLKALKLAEELGNKKSIAVHLGNIGIIYKDLGNLQKALTTYLQALKMAEELRYKQLQSNTLGNIGNIYIDFGKSSKIVSDRESSFKKALDYFFKAYSLSEERSDKIGMARHLGSIGLIYAYLNKYNDSYSYIYKGLSISESVGALIESKNIYQHLSTLYENSTISLPDTIGGKILNKEQMRLRSLYYFKRYIALSDTIFSEENKKQLVRKEMDFEFEKKETATKAEQDKKDAIAAEELLQKETERNYFIAGFVLVALLALFVLRGYRQKQKANKIITQQKELVDEKQKEILDSIRYAKRIQSALITNEKYIDKNLERLIKIEK